MKKKGEISLATCSKGDTALMFFSVIMGYVITVLFDAGYLDHGLEINGIRFIPTYSLIFYVALPILWFLKKDRETLKNLFYIDKNIIIYTLVICLPLIILNIANTVLESSMEIAYSREHLLQNIFQYWITASFVEEVFFRGYLYLKLKKIMNTNAAQIISALIFATWHVSLMVTIFNTSSFLTLMNLVAIFFLGIATARILEHSKSLIPCIVFHALVNGALLSKIMLFN